MVEPGYTVVKALNNNVVIAADGGSSEVIFIGKGIGFGKKKGDAYTDMEHDKVYRLMDETEQARYKALVKEDDEERLLAVHEAIQPIQAEIGFRWPDATVFALTQHLALALKRTTDGTDIQNPFLLETKWLYRESYQLAEKAVQYLNKRTGLTLPEAEVGFVTLHIQSALRSVNPHQHAGSHNDLIERSLSYVEEKAQMKLTEQSRSVRRFVSLMNQIIRDPEPPVNDQVVMDTIMHLKDSFDLCYTISRNVIRMIEKTDGMSVGDKDALHLMLALHSVLEEDQTEPNS
ncbi:transcriptional antiterminator, BglG family [Salisediminibacterium beveridgei]|uniref:Transcriptional antiterminator, BglG family n=2 Tax=Salisediminibacterium beveridgei TaxID=632773 RepID=A0A1D7QTM5_9BACI|nr:transcriptional antiterminator, BglG family [Salisediminibacterium beveridgei]